MLHPLRVVSAGMARTFMITAGGARSSVADPGIACAPPHPYPTSLSFLWVLNGEAPAVVETYMFRNTPGQACGNLLKQRLKRR